MLITKEHRESWKVGIPAIIPFTIPNPLALIIWPAGEWVIVDQAGRVIDKDYGASLKLEDVVIDVENGVMERIAEHKLSPH